MNFRQSAKITFKYTGFIGFIKWLFPIHTCKGRYFLMRPSWYNGNFSWVSLNKWK